MNLNEINAITEKVIACSYTVSNKLGCGFLEKVYENAMAIELSKRGVKFEQQKPLKVYYDEIIVGDYFCDLFVEQEIIVEFKTVKIIFEPHHAQLLNYLKACRKQVGLIINFAHPQVEIKRVITSFNFEKNAIFEKLQAPKNLPNAY